VRERTKKQLYLTRNKPRSEVKTGQSRSLNQSIRLGEGGKKQTYRAKKRRGSRGNRKKEVTLLRVASIGSSFASVEPHKREINRNIWERERDVLADELRRKTADLQRVKPGEKIEESGEKSEKKEPNR